MDNLANCGSCKFWEQLCDKSPDGYCRINPPVILLFPGRDPDEQVETRWPVTMEEDWCGKFEGTF